MKELIQKIKDGEKKLTRELIREFKDFALSKQMPTHYWKEGVNREATQKALPAFVQSKRGGNYNQGA